MYALKDGWLHFKSNRLAETKMAFGLLMLDLTTKLLSYIVPS